MIFYDLQQRPHTLKAANQKRVILDDGKGGTINMATWAFDLIFSHKTIPDTEFEYYAGEKALPPTLR